MDGAREVAWAVVRAGSPPEQLSGDFEALVEQVEAASVALFPRRLGYATRTELVANQAVRLEVRRGDFQGVVELCCDSFGGPACGRIRAMTTVRSQRLTQAQHIGERAIRRAQGLAVGVGGLMGAGFCWLAAGVQMPLIGGLMLSIITACLLVGGGNLGLRVGEGVAHRRRVTAEQLIQADLGIQADIRRWNSLNRQLRGHRRSLARGVRGGPFRREA